MKRPIERFTKGIFTAAAMMLTTMASAAEAPDGYTHILSETESFELEGEQVSLPFDVWLSPRMGEEAAYFDLWVDADLADFQTKAPDILNGAQQSPACGDRVRVNSVNLTPREDKAQLCARVYHERWQCLHAVVPKMSGFKITMRRTVAAKTRLVSQHASVCADLWPEVDANGGGVRIDGRVTRSSVSKSAGLLGDVFNARGQFRARLHGQINRSMADLRVLVPEALRPFDPVVKTADFTTREDGTLGLIMTLEVRVMSDDLPAIMALLTAE